MTGPQAPTVDLRHVSKRFHGVQALSDVDLVIQPGEVHGLLGENGSGKSTLIKILAGYHEPELGASLSVAGRRLHFPLPPGMFRSVGMSFVHQDLGLVGELSVLENLWLGRLVTTHRWRLPWRQLRHEALDVFARYGLGLDPDSKVVELNSTDGARLAIVRAVEELPRDRAQDDGTTAGLLVLDEPTVFLPADGVVQLSTLIRDIVATGASVLLVSHDLGEAREITDRLTVLRNGRVAGVVNTAASTEDDLVELIVGRRLGPPTGPVTATASPRSTAASGVRVRALRGGLLDATSFECGRGEVLGLTGLVGSGFSDAIYLIFGALRAAEGTLVVDGVRHDLRRMTPQRATAAGIALLPANRQRDASVADLTVAENVMAPVLDELAPHRALRVRELSSRCRRLLQRFDVRPPRPELTFDALSGGNQQKALVAKWLQSRPKLLLLHEPTQGVDVGARRQITAIMREAAESGTSIICSSTDAEQLAALCDRVLVFTRGRISAEVAGDRLDSEHISELVFNSPGRPRAAPRGAGV